MITVTILTLNAEERLKKQLPLLQTFDEVLLLDTGSKDESRTLATTFSNTTWRESPFIGFGPLHNIAVAQARNDWILSIDSDEIPDATLIEAILHCHLNPNFVYTVTRENIYRKKLVRGSGWGKESIVRLFHRKTTCFSSDAVHERVLSDNLPTEALPGRLLHESYRSVEDFLTKMQLYSTLFADQNLGGKKSSPLKAVGHAAFAFFRSYFLQRGFLDGYAGFLISSAQGCTTLFKYLKLYERQC